MDLKDKKYQKLSVLGSTILLLVIISGDFLNIYIRFLLLGIAVGWLGAVWFLRYLILKEERDTARSKSSEILSDLEKISEPPKNKIF